MIDNNLVPYLFVIGNIQNICSTPDPIKNTVIGESLGMTECENGTYRCTIPAIAVEIAAKRK